MANNYLHADASSLTDFAALGPVHMEVIVCRRWREKRTLIYQLDPSGLW